MSVRDTGWSSASSRPWIIAMLLGKFVFLQPLTLLLRDSKESAPHGLMSIKGREWLAGLRETQMWRSSQFSICDSHTWSQSHPCSLAIVWQKIFLHCLLCGNYIKPSSLHLTVIRRTPSVESSNRSRYPIISKPLQNQIWQRIRPTSTSLPTPLVKAIHTKYIPCS